MPLLIAPSLTAHAASLRRRCLCDHRFPLLSHSHRFSLSTGAYVLCISVASVEAIRSHFRLVVGVVCPRMNCNVCYEEST